MIQSKLIQYLSKLSKKDRERFRLFVVSPYFNQHVKTIELLDIILNKMVDNPKNNFNREKLFAMLFPEQAYNEQQLHNVMSYLKKLFHRFLAFKQLEEDEFREQLFTVEQAYTSNQYDLMTNRAKQLEKKLEQTSHKNSNHYYFSYKLNQIIAYYRGNHVERAKVVNFQTMLDSLDRFFILEKLRNCCHLQANIMLMNTEYDFGLFEEINTFLEKNSELLEQVVSIDLYKTIFLTLSDEKNPDHYEKLKALLQGESLNQFSREERNDLYTFSTNFCIQQINKGRSDYQRELFDLYKEGVNKDLLVDNNVMSEWVYKNVVTLGCKMKEFKWTETFIHNFKEKLPAAKQENAYNYNLGNLFYNKKQYNEAIERLLYVEFNDPKYHLNTTFLLLRTYYAQGDTEALLSLIDTFRVYVIRNKNMTTSEKKGVTNFLRFAKKLVLLKHQASTYTKKALQEKLEALSQKISQTENVINKYWLLEESAAA